MTTSPQPSTDQLTKISSHQHSNQELLDIHASLSDLQDEVKMLKKQIDTTRTRFDVSDELAASFENEKKTALYKEVFTKPNPLVSICVATYNRADLLIERCVKSLQAQTYENIEVIVVGDACTDETEERMSEIVQNDSRFTFENLPKRGSYPEEPRFRWMVAGTPVHNRAMQRAKGDFITHLDHDDEHRADRVQKLVDYIREEEADVVYHPFLLQQKDESWKTIESKAFERGAVSTSSVLYHKWFSRILYDPYSYRYRETGDWSRFRRMRYLGATIKRFPDILLDHYMQMTSLRK